MLRDSKADRLADPNGWLFYRVSDSKFLNATLSEIRNEWSVGDLHDAWRRIDLYERAEEERNKPKPSRRR
jgi:hypothetical protein